MQLREGRTVEIDGARYEVRRTTYVRPLGHMAPELLPDGSFTVPDAPPSGELPGGAPSVAVEGIPDAPDMFEIATRAVLLACGFLDEGDAIRGGGFDPEGGHRPMGEGSAIYYPVRDCPGLDLDV